VGPLFYLNRYEAIARRIVSDNIGFKLKFWNRYGGSYDFDTKTASVPYVRGDVSLKVVAHELSHHKRGMIRPVWFSEVVADVDAIVTLWQYGYDVGPLAVRRMWKYHVEKIAKALRRGYSGEIPAELDFLKADVQSAIRMGTEAWKRTTRGRPVPMRAYLSIAAAVVAPNSLHR